MRLPPANVLLLVGRFASVRFCEITDFGPFMHSSDAGNFQL